MEVSSTPGPLTSLVNHGFDLVSEHVPRDLTWPILLVTLIIAICIWAFRGGLGSKDASGRMRRAGLIKFLFPRDIYTHLSARVDVTLYIFERCLRPIWVATFLVLIAPATEKTVMAGLLKTIGSGPGLSSSFVWMLFYSFITLLIYDFIFFVIHYAEHRIPTLWALHKVHHSAEVLTPLTRYREHFLEGPIYAIGAAIAYGLSGGFFGWLFITDITQATFLNVGFFSLLFGFNGSFRHYHVAFHYPRWLSRWLQSPVMHHIHHSYLQKHWGTNLGVVTSIWDRLFGTIYIPEKDEYTPWGLGPETQDQYRTFSQNTLGPFKDWYGLYTNFRRSRAD